jgi:hypothetical protein
MLMQECRQKHESLGFKYLSNFFLYKQNYKLISSCITIDSVNIAGIISINEVLERISAIAIYFFGNLDL